MIFIEIMHLFTVYTLQGFHGIVCYRAAMNNDLDKTDLVRTLLYIIHWLAVLTYLLFSYIIPTMHLDLWSKLVAKSVTKTISTLYYMFSVGFLHDRLLI